MFDLNVLGTAWAGTGTAADAIQTRFISFMAGLGVMAGGAAVIWKGVSQLHEGEHMGSKTLAQFGTGGVLIGGGATLAPWLAGAAMGHTGSASLAAPLGDTLAQLLNPVSPLPVALLYYYYRTRGRRRARR